MHTNVTKFLEGFRYDAHPMGTLLGAVGALSTFYPDAKDIADPENRYLQRVRLIAKFPTIAAFAFRHSRGLPYVFPRNDLSYIGNFVNMTFEIGGRHEPNLVVQRALEILLILHADHAGLDPIAASMIPQYRANNGLGAVAVDPELMRLAEAQSQAMADKNKLDHDVRAPLAKRLAGAGYPATVAVENVSAGYHTLAEAFSGLARLAAAQGQYAQKRCHKTGHRRKLRSEYEIQGILDADFGVY